MGTIAITENHPKWTLYSRMRKCGEITTSSNGRYFGLNCVYCPTIFPWVNIKDLLGHLHEKHASELHTAARQEQWQKPKKLELSPAPVSPEHGVGTSAIGLREDPLAADICAVSTIKREEDYYGTEQVLAEEFLDIGCEVEEQHKKVFESCSDSDDKGAYETEMQSKNNSSETEENDLSGNKLDLQSLENREVLSYIIEVYKENAILWDKEHPHFQFFRKKSSICKKMIQEIYCRFKITLTYGDIRVAFKGLRNLYTLQLLHEDNEAHSERLWCFENLEFLRNRELADNAELIIPMDQLIPLAEIYERYPVLWDLDCDESHNRVRQIEEQQQMLQEANAKLGVNMTLKQFRLRLLRIRKHLRSDRRKRIKCEQDGNEEFEPQHPELYAKLQYLERFVGPHHCDMCGKDIFYYKAFKLHLAAHEGRLPYKCDICQAGYKNYSNFKVHVRRHTGEKPFVCKYCDMRFVAGTDLKGHEATHTRENNLVCHICGMAFILRSTLWKHKATHDPNRKRLPCPQCTKTFLNKQNLVDHINKHKKLRSAVCSVCGKGFVSSNTLRQHMQLHDKVKRYQCELCAKKFAQKAGLCSHMRTHQIAEICEPENSQY